MPDMEYLHLLVDKSSRVTVLQGSKLVIEGRRRNGRNCYKQVFAG